MYRAALGLPVLCVSLRTLTVPFLLATWAASCVPSEPTDAVPTASSARPASNANKASAAKKAEPRATAPSARKPAKLVPGDMIASTFEDRFDRASIGEDWHRLGTAWSIKDGKLCGKGARNQGIWLRRRLPTNARIEFEASSDSPDGDIKAEFWGDGSSGATAASYSNATSYLTIFGGWKNTYHVLARIDEHAKDRLAIQINPDSTHVREMPVSTGQIYRFRVERSDGKTVSWWVDDQLIHKLADPNPLLGEGHEYFGFNNWEAPVCFGNLTITPL